MLAEATDFADFRDGFLPNAGACSSADREAQKRKGEEAFWAKAKPAILSEPSFFYLLLNEKTVLQRKSIYLALSGIISSSPI